ncbi:MAG: hypothetical protein JWM35_2468 [Verrucomicrobia bacterium]|nr:hypothetical protein [Verrucomicrobiota bacterium]
MNRTGKFFALALLALGVGTGLALQRHVNLELRGEAELLREQNREVARLRDEREKLLGVQPPAAELARLRADHVAVAQLRDEVDALRTGVTGMEKAEAK